MAESTSLVLYDPRSAGPEVVALAGFLAGYGGRTPEACALDLRQFFAWCTERHLRLFDAHRTDIELYARELEERGKARATIGRRPSTIAGFYRYAGKEDSSSTHRPCMSAGLASTMSPMQWAWTATNWEPSLWPPGWLRPRITPWPPSWPSTRISEALGADVEQLGLERGHRTLLVHREGGKTVTIPLAPRTARAIDLVVGERLEGPILVDALGHRLGRDAAARMVRRLAKRAGIAKRIGPHRLRHSFITAAQFRRWRAAARRAGGGLPRRSPHHHALRPGPPVP